MQLNNGSKGEYGYQALVSINVISSADGTKSAPASQDVDAFFPAKAEMAPTATPPAAAVPSTAANAAPPIAADWQNANHEPAGTAAPKTDDWMPAAMDPE